MAFPWFKVIDAAIGFTDIARLVRGERAPSGNRTDLAETATHSLEARLANVVVAALKETFDRDHQRLALERERAEAERFRAIRAERLALVRHAADRELMRLRLVAGLSVAGWLVPLVWAGVLLDGETATRVALGLGWLLLVSALAAALSGQASVSRAADQATARVMRDEPGTHAQDGFVTGAGALAPWLMVAGFVMVAFSALLG
jgi:hypothetical protein